MPLSCKCKYTSQLFIYYHPVGMLEPRLSSTSAPRARARASLRSPTAATWTYSRTWRWTWTRRDGICSSTVSPTSSDIQTLTPTTSHAVSSTCLQRLTRRLSKSRSQGKIREIYTVPGVNIFLLEGVFYLVGYLSLPGISHFIVKAIVESQMFICESQTV